MSFEKGRYFMKKLMVFFLFLIGLSFSLTANAFHDLDRILEYKITVNPRDDGTLDMNYYIKWMVLDSTSEGPLEWVKIGVPNKYVDEIEAKSAAIEDIYYYPDGGAYIRIDLNRKYRAGEIVILNFSFHQSRIYTVDDTYVYYQFVPGWFDEIKVDMLQVLWKADNVYGQNSKSQVGDYYYWQCSLDYGERTSIELQYNQSAFPNIDLEATYSDDDGDYTYIIIIIFVAVIITLIIVVSVINSIKQRDSYYSYRGFSGRYYHNYYFWRRRPHHGVNKRGDKITPPVVVSSGGNFRGGSGCACACACACAGGGRAGCSRKDFYNPNINVDQISKITKKAI